MSPTLINLVEDHWFISEEYYLHLYEVFLGKPKTKLDENRALFYSQDRSHLDMVSVHSYILLLPECLLYIYRDNKKTKKKKQEFLAFPRLSFNSFLGLFWLIKEFVMFLVQYRNFQKRK